MIELEPRASRRRRSTSTRSPREYGARRSSVRREFEDAIARIRERAAVARLEQLLVARGPVDLASWEPAYGRLAEAQVRWESTHGRPLPVG